MKKFKRLSIVATLALGLFVFTGCGKENVEKGPNFKIVYEADREVDKVEYKINDYDLSLQPMNNDKKVKKDYTGNVNILDSDSGNFSIMIKDEGEVLFEKNDIALDFSDDKIALVSIIENDKGELDIKVDNKK